MKTPEQIADAVIEANYGAGTKWAAPNANGDAGFTRAQAEAGIDANGVHQLIVQAVNADRAQWFDTASSASRQHYIDTGRYLLHEEVDAASNEPALVDEPLSQVSAATIEASVERSSRGSGVDIIATGGMGLSFRVNVDGGENHGVISDNGASYDWMTMGGSSGVAGTRSGAVEAVAEAVRAENAAVPGELLSPES